jgi:hypothetical protein
MAIAPVVPDAKKLRHASLLACEGSREAVASIVPPPKSKSLIALRILALAASAV